MKPENAEHGDFPNTRTMRKIHTARVYSCEMLYHNYNMFYMNLDISVKESLIVRVLAEV